MTHQEMNDFIRNRGVQPVATAEGEQAEAAPVKLATANAGSGLARGVPPVAHSMNDRIRDAHYGRGQKSWRG